MTSILFLLIASVIHAGQVIRDGTVGPAGALPGPDFLIPDTDGATRGNNLFHSFNQFNLDAGESATFTGPDNIRNVLARVTGGNASMIDGALNCEIEGANFFFINPFGVIFGPNAQVNVSGSLAVTTADYVKLADGGRFDARNPANDVLTTAPVSAFGFLGPTVAPIVLAGVAEEGEDPPIFTFLEEKSIWLVGGDIRVEGFLPAALGGQITMVSVASAGELEVNVDEIGADVDTSSFAALGSLTLAGRTTLFVSGFPPGLVLLEADSIVLNDAGILADNFGDASGIGGIELRARSSIELQLAQLLSVTFDEGDAGRITLTAPVVRMTLSNIGVFTVGDGRAGEIQIVADQFSLLLGGGIDLGTSGSGAAGNLTIIADHVLIHGDPLVGAAPGLRASTSGAPAGEIRIEADTVQLLAGGTIQSDSTGEGLPGGDIHINARTLTLDDQNGTGLTQISTRSIFDGSGGGNIVLNVNRLEVLNGAQITATTFNDAPAGNITITGHDAIVAGHSSIQSAAFEQSGIAGSVTLSLTGSLLLRDGGLLSVSAFQNAGGDVTVTAGDSIRLVNGQINAEAFLDGGNVRLMTPRLVYLLNSQIQAKSIEGNGGNITIDPVFVVLNNSLLQASAIIGNGGNITIVSDFFLSSASIIDASSEFGLQGSVNITSPNADLAGNFVGLDEDPLDAESRLRPHCAVRLPTGVSSFIITGRGGVPMEPDGLLPELPGR